MKNKTAYKSIDFFKFIFAVFIVALHTHLYRALPFSWYVEVCFFRLAVPFFFIVSGYFFGKKITVDGADIKKTAKNYVIHLLKPYLIFLAINCVLEITKFVMQGFTLKAIVITVIRSSIFYPYGALWYIWASMIAVVLLSAFLLIGKEKIAYILAVPTYIITLMCNSYYFVIMGTPLQKAVDLYILAFKTARNGFFLGFSLITFGYFIASYQDRLLKKISDIKLAAAAIVGEALLFLEAYLLEGKPYIDESSIYISLIIVVPSAVLFLLRKEIPISNELSLFFRKMSTYLFFVHRPIYSVLVIFERANKTKLTDLTEFIIVFLWSFIISYILYCNPKIRKAF